MYFIETNFLNCFLQGGLKAVLWTDVLQAIIMFGSMITVLVVGIYELGGFGVLWSRVEATGRTNVLM